MNSRSPRTPDWGFTGPAHATTHGEVFRTWPNEDCQPDGRDIDLALATTTGSGHHGQNRDDLGGLVNMRTARLLATAILGLVSSVAAVAPAAAEPSAPYYCSGWSQVNAYVMHRACTGYEVGGTVMGHEVEVQNISGVDYYVRVEVTRFINGYSAVCEDNWHLVPAYQTRTMWCSSGRVSGWTYKTQSYVHDNGLSNWATSPTEVG